MVAEQVFKFRILTTIAITRKHHGSPRALCSNAYLTLSLPVSPLKRHYYLVKFTYIMSRPPPRTSVLLVHPRCAGAEYMSSRHMSQVLACHVTIWNHCDSLHGVMWDSEMSPVPSLCLWLWRHLDYIHNMYTYHAHTFFVPWASLRTIQSLYEM